MRDDLWCEPWGHFLGHCAYNSIKHFRHHLKSTQRTCCCFCHSAHTSCWFFWQLKSQFSKWYFLAFSQVEGSVLQESVLPCSAILLTWIPKQISLAAQPFTIHSRVALVLNTWQQQEETLKQNLMPFEKIWQTKLFNVCSAVSTRV